MRNKITIQDIANKVGMSKYAVSRALSGKSGVSTETRQYIAQIAEQMGYSKEKSFTKQLTPSFEFPIEKWTGTILILFPDVRYRNTESLYWGPVFNGVTSVLEQKGVNIITLTEPSNESIFSLLNPEAIKGIVTLGTISTSILLDIQQLNIPVVMIDHLDPSFQSDSIFADNTGSIQQIMYHLIRDGYRKFQFIGNIQDAASFNQRYLAYRSALDEHNIEVKQNIRLLSREVDSIHELMPEIVEQDELPEVYVCSNDTTALFAIEALEKLGIQVPRDVIFTGFDHIYPELPLYATVDVNKSAIGSRAVDQLFWRIMNSDYPFEKKLLATQLILNKQHARLMQRTT